MCVGSWDTEVTEPRPQRGVEQEELLLQPSPQANVLSSSLASCPDCPDSHRQPQPCLFARSACLPPPFEAVESGSKSQDPPSRHAHHLRIVAQHLPWQTPSPLRDPALAPVHPAHTPGLVLDCFSVKSFQLPRS